MRSSAHGQVSRKCSLEESPSRCAVSIAKCPDTRPRAWHCCPMHQVILHKRPIMRHVTTRQTLQSLMTHAPLHTARTPDSTLGPFPPRPGKRDPHPKIVPDCWGPLYEPPLPPISSGFRLRSQSAEASLYSSNKHSAPGRGGSTTHGKSGSKPAFIGPLINGTPAFVGPLEDETSLHRSGSRPKPNFKPSSSGDESRYKVWDWPSTGSRSGRLDSDAPHRDW
jgi:hypothetical protein